MSVYKSSIYLISLQPRQVDQWLETLLNYKYLEILDPRSLGSQWSEVSLLEVKEEQSSSAITKLDYLLKETEVKGFLNTFIDQSVEVSNSDLEKAKSEQKYILDLTQEFIEYKEFLKAQIKFQKVIKNKKQKTFFAGHALLEFKTFLEEFSRDTIRQFQQNHPNQELSIETPEINIERLNSVWEILITDSEHNDFLIKAYQAYEHIKKGAASKLYSLNEFDDLLRTEITRYNLLLKNKGFDPIKPSTEVLKKVTALQTHLQIQAKIKTAHQFLFRTETDGAAVFAIVAVPPKLKQLFLELSQLNQIPTQEIHWNQEIVTWKQNENLKGFQKVAQSLGTIDTKEADPTKVIGVFFSLFFAFCLGDALYGLFLAIFCGYFIIFKKLKPQFENIFNLFFYSGLATVIFGAATNSWAGDLFAYTSAKDFFNSLQIINVLDPNANAPINVLLKENGGLSPIVFMLAISLLIGIVNIFSAYILGLRTSYKSLDWESFKSKLSWSIFVISLIAFFILPSFSSFLGLISTIILAISLISLFVFNDGKSLFSKILSGLGSLYGLIGFFADVLSFTRLVAVGLTGGIIANVINLLAILIFNAIPVTGLNYLVTGLVLIGGHLFNFIISLFGAYVNPLRLHYVEFLPKFYEGRGRELKPLN